MIAARRLLGGAAAGRELAKPSRIAANQPASYISTMDLFWYVTARLLARARSDTCRRNQDNCCPDDIKTGIAFGSGLSILVQKLVPFFQFQRKKPAPNPQISFAASRFVVVSKRCERNECDQENAA